MTDSLLHDQMFGEILHEVRRWVTTLGMPVELAILFVAVGVLLVVDYRFIRPRLDRHRRPPPSIAFNTGRERHDTNGREEWAVICRHCRARNRLGYRYCFSCITPLPQRVVKTADDDGT